MTNVTVENPTVAVEGLVKPHMELMTFTNYAEFNTQPAQFPLAFRLLSNSNLVDGNDDVDPARIISTMASRIAEGALNILIDYEKQDNAVSHNLENCEKRTVMLNIAKATLPAGSPIKVGIYLERLYATSSMDNFRDAGTLDAADYFQTNHSKGASDRNISEWHATDNANLQFVLDYLKNYNPTNPLPV